MCVLVSNEYRHETNLGSTHTARPGVELPVNVQTNGLELNCDSSSCVSEKESLVKFPEGC